MDNIVACLANFLACSDIDSIAFCWVMHKQAIIDEILSRLDVTTMRVVGMPLVCDEQTLRDRLMRDVDAGLRESDVVERSAARLTLYASLKTTMVDMTSLLPRSYDASKLPDIGGHPCRGAGRQQSC